MSNTQHAHHVLVPVKPTPEMLLAGHHKIDWCRDGQKTNVMEDASQVEIISGQTIGTTCKQDLTDAWEAMLAAAFAAPQAAEVGELDPLTVTLEWAKVETKALEEWRAEFGDYVALVTLGHDNVWAHRVNNTGSLHYKTADDAKAAALTDLRNRLSIRLHAARKAVTLYDRAPSREPEGGAAPFDRDALIALIMEETNDDIVADGWDRLGKPNVLVQGCRYIRRNAPPSPEGYANPEASAKQFAGFIADRILAALQAELKGGA